MRKLLLIMGDLATGKSTFAKILSMRYNTNVFFKDSIKEVLGDTIGFSNREENKKLSSATMELMFFIFSEFGKLNKNLILESNFHTAELERLHKIAFENNYEVLTLVLRGDVEILHKRYLNRMDKIFAKVDFPVAKSPIISNNLLISYSPLIFSSASSL